MLSRVADAMYWMSRYLERADNIARYVDVNWHLTLDLPNSDSDMEGEEMLQWRPLTMVTGDSAIFEERYRVASKENVLQFLMFDPEYPNSILSCLRASRENARSIRDILIPEFWEQLNILYHSVEQAARNPAPVFENPYEFCMDLKLHGILLGGIADGTMTHGEGWHFFRVGRLLERADKITRILDVKYFFILPAVNYVGTVYDDILWAALLRSTSSFEEYRHRYGRIMPGDVVDFLLLGKDFPRAVYYCLQNSLQSLNIISGTSAGSFSNIAERTLGRLCANLAYESVDEIIAQGLHQFLDQLQVRMNTVDRAVASSFFLHAEAGQTQDQQ